MTKPGKDAKFLVSANDSDWYEVDGIKEYTCDPDVMLHDSTDFVSASLGSGDYDETKTFVAGLSDGTLTFSGDYEDETNGQGTVRVLFSSGAAIYVKALHDGTNGKKITGIVSDYKVSGKADDLTKFSATVAFNSAIADTP